MSRNCSIERALKCLIQKQDEQVLEDIEVLNRQDIEIARQESRFKIAVLSSVLKEIKVG